jgi:hypothetical protein
VPALVSQLVAVFSQGEPEEEAESGKRLRKNGSCSSLNCQERTILTQSPLAAARDKREFADAGSENRNVPPILRAGVTAVGRRSPALRRGPIPGPSARERARRKSIARWCEGESLASAGV